MRSVQFIPSGEVIIRVAPPVLPTAQNRTNSGDQAIARQVLSAALVLIVQVMPSGEVITRSPVPFSDTAAKRPKLGE